MSDSSQKVINRIKERMIIGTIYDQLLLRFKYNDAKTNSLYRIMVGQKHRMIFYRRLKSKYLERCIKNRSYETLPKRCNCNTVWFMWLQGIDNAPEIVRKCLESQRNCLSEKNIVILDEKNVFEYITLPQYILEKREAGIIADAHFSDLIRNELLIHYGGYWIDSTVYMTDNSLIKHIDDIPLFMFSYYYFGFNPEVMELNNWFIHSYTNNNIICLVQRMLLEYWKDNDYAMNYFIYHIFESIANDYYEQEYKEIPIVSQAPSHILATYIYDDFDKKKFDMLLMSTGIHKLSTRFDMTKLKKKGNFYDVIVNR